MPRPVNNIQDAQDPNSSLWVDPESSSESSSREAGPPPASVRQSASRESGSPSHPYTVDDAQSRRRRARKAISPGFLSRPTSPTPNIYKDFQRQVRHNRRAREAISPPPFGCSPCPASPTPPFTQTLAPLAFPDPASLSSASIRQNPALPALDLVNQYFAVETKHYTQLLAAYPYGTTPPPDCINELGRCRSVLAYLTHTKLMHHYYDSLHSVGLPGAYPPLALPPVTRFFAAEQES